MFNFFKKWSTKNVQETPKVSQNDESEMKDGLPMVHDKVFVNPKRFKIISVNTDRKHKLVGTDLSVVIDSNNYDVCDYSKERGFIILKKDNTVIKAKEIKEK